MTTHIEIELTGLLDDKRVLARIGDRLQLGGPDGNHAVRPDEESGWGMHWDALFDCFLNLHSGGIWGTSPVFTFPLRLSFIGSGHLRREAPRAFSILLDILEQTREAYARRGLKFEFDLGWAPGGA
ncbi:hypothetical protein GN316_06790 [Xylophilus sp. Kf1]|nr:hypothetical protein [Xylophilus sp. Kf1]